MSKIIEIEKGRQKEYMKLREFRDESFNIDCSATHKQSLINFKEYLEENFKILETDIGDEICLTDDIEELNKMINKYEC